MDSALLIMCLALLAPPRPTSAGFLHGAPCSPRNTVFLSPARPRLPKGGAGAVRCADITAMGSVQVLANPELVENATTIYADRMRLAEVPLYATRLARGLLLLDLSGNEIRRVRRDTFGFNPVLETLLLADNRVAMPKKSYFLDCPSLKTLSLSNNAIRRMGHLTFTKLANLEVLYLDRNKLRRLSSKTLAPLRKLRYLHLGNNQLKRVPLTLKGAGRRMVVIAKGNPLNRTEPIK